MARPHPRLFDVAAGRSFEAVEERVKQLHGTIDVDADDSGTRVVVRLPPHSARR